MNKSTVWNDNTPENSVHRTVEIKSQFRHGFKLSRSRAGNWPAEFLFTFQTWAVIDELNRHSRRHDDDTINIEWYLPMEGWRVSEATPWRWQRWNCKDATVFWGYITFSTKDSKAGKHLAIVDHGDLSIHSLASHVTKKAKVAKVLSLLSPSYWSTECKFNFILARFKIALFHHIIHLFQRRKRISGQSIQYR